MSLRLFLSKAISKFERIDKESLVKLALQLTQDNKLLEELIENLSIGILVFDSKLRIKTINRLMKSILGIPASTEVSGGLESVLLDPDFHQEVSRHAKRGTEIFDQSFEWYIPRHIRGTWTLREFALASGENPKEAFFALIINSESSKEEKLKERHHAEKLQSLLTLASGIAHELGNPLNSIGVHLHLMASDIAKLPEPHKTKLKKSVEIVAEEAGRLDNIVRNFLKSTRQKPLHFQIADIHEPIKQTLLLLEPEIQKARVKVKTDFDRDMPEFYMDVERLSRVFINLIKNALQAMPEGGQIKFLTRQRKNSCEIQITDTGSGIRQSELPKIFDAYYTTKEEGSGLGLVISYQIIREHSGKIEVESKLGKGTAITITLPIRKEKLQLPAPKEKSTKRSAFI